VLVELSTRLLPTIESPVAKKATRRWIRCVRRRKLRFNQKRRGEVDFSRTASDHRSSLFATGDSIVGNNLVLTSTARELPEARMYLSRSSSKRPCSRVLLTLSTLHPTTRAREGLRAIETIPPSSARRLHAQWISSIDNLEKTETQEQKRQF